MFMAYLSASFAYCKLLRMGNYFCRLVLATEHTANTCDVRIGEPDCAAMTMQALFSDWFAQRPYTKGGEAPSERQWFVPELLAVEY